MTPNSDWWEKTKRPPRPQPIEIRTRQLFCTLRKGEHEIALEKRAVPAMGQELIFTVNGHWRMRVFKPRGPLLSGAVAETVTKLEARGWQA